MDYGRWLRISIWAMGGLFALMGGCLIVDSTGPHHQTYGTVLSTRFVEGWTTTTDVKVGEVAVPIRTEIPGSWIAEIDAPVLGRVQVPVGDDFKDAYRENVERLIEQKRKGQKITIVKQPRKAPVIDLMEALKRSLKSGRPSKPASKDAHRAGASRKPSGRHRAA